MVERHGEFAEAPEPRGRFERAKDFFGGSAGPSAEAGAAERGEAPALPGPRVFTVTQLCRLIKLTLTEHLPARVIVRGELSKWEVSQSGHVYPRLKDEGAVVDAVMWRSAAVRLKFTPADGMEVIATGTVDFYEPQGRLQLYLEKLEPAGVGALELGLRQLAQKLRGEGLFDAARKKPLPRFPRTIALVTSPTGAALEDIVKTLNRRYPIVRKLLYPVKVQGEGAAAELAAAIRQLNRRREELGGIDVMIVGRGGGSLEDLWAFNEEEVARAIFASRIPVISAVGHEVDTTIADLVADVRAATPTAAAELATPLLTEVRADLALHQRRLAQGVQQRWLLASRALEGWGGRPLFTRPLDLVRYRQQGLDQYAGRLQQGWGHQVYHLGRRLQERATVLRAIEPHRALQRAAATLGECEHQLRQGQRDCYRTRGHALDQWALRLQGAGPAVHVPHQRQALEQAQGRAVQAGRQLTWRHRQQVEAWARQLESLDPRAVLRRGYSITRLAATGAMVRADSRLRAGEMLTTELAGEVFLESQVTSPPAPRKEGHG